MSKKCKSCGRVISGVQSYMGGGCCEVCDLKSKRARTHWGEAKKFQNRVRFKPKTERENLAALYGVWVAIWTALLLLVAPMVVFQILSGGVHYIAGVGGIFLYFFVLFVVFRWAIVWKIIDGLAGAFVAMEIADRKKRNEKHKPGVAT